MAKIGIFYGSSTGNTELIAEKIKALFGNDADTCNIDAASIEDIEKYEFLIFGTSSWGIGDTQDDWDDFMDILSGMTFNKKKLALFGLGDQINYPDSFADGIGIIYDAIYDRVDVVGAWPLDGYTFNESAAVKNGMFVGLAIDKENQPHLTDSRLEKWVNILKKEMIS
ncbi:MAG: flavodoxin [Bacteroidales bacterium]|nr:flavodoxin [Bacteroidales bacterium]